MQDFLSSGAKVTEPVAAEVSSEERRRNLREALASHRHAIAANKAAVADLDAQIAVERGQLEEPLEPSDDGGASHLQTIHQRITQHERNKASTLHASALLQPEIDELTEALK